MKFRPITSKLKFSEISLLNNECTGMNELKKYFNTNSIETFFNSNTDNSIF